MENKIKNKSNKFIIIAFIIILIIQILTIIYATSKREYYHIDELYSYGLMQYKNAFIYENEDFVNNWHNTDYFKDYLEINEDEKYDFSAVYKNQIQDVHPPFYYLLLRIACSFNIGSFSIWTGTILNIIIFVFSIIMVYLIGKKIFQNKYYALLVCCLYGFSLASIETVMYVRMYQLLILNILILIYWHLIKKEKESLEYKDLIPLYFMVLFGFLTHYYYTIFVVILYLIYMIKFIKSKNYKELLKYTLNIIVSFLTSIIIFPFSINHIFFSYRGKEITSNLKSFDKYFLNLWKNLQIINTDFFCDFMYIICIIMVVLFLFIIIKKKNKNKINEDIKYVAIPMIIYFIISSIISPYLELRYLMPIIPLVFCTLLYFMYYLLSNVFNNYKITFYILLIGVVVFSLLSIPHLSDNLYTYNDYKDVKEIMQNNNLEDIPWIYIYIDSGPKYNKTIESYQAFITVNETYIMAEEKVETSEILKVLEEKDTTNGIVVMTHYLDNKKNLDAFMQTGLFNECEYQCILGRYEVYLLK